MDEHATAVFALPAEQVEALLHHLPQACRPGAQAVLLIAQRRSPQRVLRDTILYVDDSWRSVRSGVPVNADDPVIRNFGLIFNYR